eukprot:CAMPEP_0198288284 /NCGR_PEP_ID=MMETSP1449-20131203/6837_1 /TAXON_ID=420275 /ORGANISM="Attheya septentrionalis, Strain CCMP2084" /LENGTH=219 /DNA_ID=CAMNT_0043986397 /DNA_START=27 /DNA_END=682 /DNA_ORIENTATION=-
MGFANGVIVLVAVATATITTSLGVSGFVPPSPTSFVGAVRTRTTITTIHPNNERIVGLYTTTTELGMVRKKKKPGKDAVQNHEKTFQPYYDELQQFYHQHGHYHVPHANNNDDDDEVNEDDSSTWHELSLWLQEQRYQCQLLREGKKARITKKRMAALERCDGALDEPPSSPSQSSHPTTMSPKTTTTIETSTDHIDVPTKNLNTQPTNDATTGTTTTT